MRHTTRNTGKGVEMTTQEIIAVWGQDLLRNLGKELPTLSYNKLHAALSDLQAKVAAKPEGGKK